ncbi:Hypothetical protein D9617_2g058270 [Elsinoe fawcettii]|nr:Hypothetical protein D9617_2g058270 [Elsinoe fawcettii]
MSVTRDSKFYGACLGGLLYNHQIDERLQQGIWIRYPEAAKSGKVTAAAQPYRLLNLSDNIYTHVPVKMALLVGMALPEELPGMDMGIGEQSDLWRTVQRPVSDMSAHKIIEHSAAAYPVVGPSESKPYELRRIPRQNVFFFGTFREAGDTLTTPATRAICWYELIRNAIAESQHAPPMLEVKTGKRFLTPRKLNKASDVSQTPSPASDDTGYPIPSTTEGDVTQLLSQVVSQPSPNQQPPLPPHQPSTSTPPITTTDHTTYRTLTSAILTLIYHARTPFYDPDTPWATPYFLNDLETQVTRIDFICAKKQLEGAPIDCLIKTLVAIVNGRVHESGIAVDAG